MIMSYTANSFKFLWPVSRCVGLSTQDEDKKSYQMNPSNRIEAGIELNFDIGEGADIIMVKPASMYLDIISDYSGSSSLPVAAYHVSGEYAMLKAAAEKGYVDYNSGLMETLTSISVLAHR